ncbi:hypothetical protein pdul_cds_487 [Pandoravirus dulcis]|uniref:Uncharacterized protein n=1 Tax=Pandoravirus dulcis TaxID=1349409 RepID=S4VQE2_9VIRU|nr:hypothetical protein pdul_cds_487 [Pandoravirus dulcis]AGO82568.1 hypothetical protein pdul_cds_487 [Pandoravirus dulcis]
MWAGASAAGAPTLAPCMIPVPDAPMDADLVERLVLDVLAGDGTAHVASAVAMLCGPQAGTRAKATADRIIDLLGYKDDTRRAAAVLCEASGPATTACFRSRAPGEWAQRYPDVGRHASALAAAVTAACDDMPTLLNVAEALRASRRARRCALYGLYSVDAATAGSKPLPFGALDLAGLEAWARGRQRSGPFVPALGLGAVPADDADRILPVVLDAVPLPRMSHNEMVAAIFVVGSADTLYAHAPKGLPAEADAMRRVNEVLTHSLILAMVATDSAPDASLTAITAEVDIFAAYPGTRVAIGRHVRDIAASTSADIGVLLALP